ncbi:RNA exonuclease 1 homolog [Acipenser ruthenus]|uniref:RNA exonuclease 1 homolog n=1 Tax=Acipenser ruthenus TaxID=7906 RepID=UPI0027420712|nr:RNA exonuclease 1 homolog [Acipenser ruthenus]
MLPSTGLFSRIDCPFSKRRICERPYCHYKHGRGTDETLFSVAASKPREIGNDNVTPPKKYNDHINKPHTLSEQDLSLLELYRINKAIETVKCEVEQEQKKLFHCKTLQENWDADPCSATATSVEPKKKALEDGNKNNATFPSRTHKLEAASAYLVTSSKYVVDKSRPATDLEYDPLSNYSADLGNNNSKQCEDPKRGIKRTMEDMYGGKSEPPYKVTRDCMAWQDELGIQESDEECDLVIDIPPLVTPFKKPRASRRWMNNESQLEGSDVGAKNLLQKKPDTTSALVEMETTDRVDPVKCLPVTLVISGKEGERVLGSHGVSSAVSLNQGSECKELIEVKKEGSVSSLTGSKKVIFLERSKSEMEQVPVASKPFEPLRVPVRCPTSDHAKVSTKLPQEQTDLSMLSKEKLKNKADPGMGAQLIKKKDQQRLGTKDMNQCLPSQQKSTVLVPQAAPFLGITMSPVQPKNQDQHITEQKSTSKNMTHCLPSQQKTSALGVPKPDPLQGEFDFAGKTASPVPPKNQDQHTAEQKSSKKYVAHSLPSPQESSTPDVPKMATTCDVAVNPSSLQPQNQDQIIKVESSSESDSSDMEMYLSDNDQMEECYRIFMEANENKPEEKERSSRPVVECIELDRPDMEKKQSLLPGQKKRVAHVSKHNVRSSRQQVIVPFREPTSQLANPTRIQQLQQQASILTAAVKGGQAFVAATTGQKKTVVAPAAPTFPSTAQTVCLNLVPIGGMAVSSWSSNVQLILPDGTITGAAAIAPATSAQQRTTYTPAKAIASRRKTNLAVEPSSKVPHDVRQRYVNMFVEEFLKTSFTVQEAFEKALAEEKAVFERSTNKIKYLSIAVNSLKRLKNQCNPSNSTDSSLQGSRGHTSASGGTLQVEKANDSAGAALYEQLKEYVMTDEMLKVNGFPLQHPDKPAAAFFGDVSKKSTTGSLKRICCRCGATYSVTSSGKHVRKEECNYHSGKVLKKKVPGGLDTRYSCCEGAVGTPGCQVFQLHVHDGCKENLEGFVKTFSKSSLSNGNSGVFALACQMCYTTQGLELARVTVVNPSLQVVYDTFVKPDSEVIDYNTRFSGVTEDDLKRANPSIRDVQAVLLNLFSAETILIGHCFENDLFALKLFHNTVIDTSIVFPHRLGLPNKRTLRKLMADYLRRIIQENVGGHDSSEDAAACMELMLWKVKEDAKVKRW